MHHQWWYETAMKKKILRNASFWLNSIRIAFEENSVEENSHIKVLCNLRIYIMIHSHIFIFKHASYYCVMHGCCCAHLTSVTIIRYAGGMISWNIYYNNLHRRSSAKISRNSPKQKREEKKQQPRTT